LRCSVSASIIKVDELNIKKIYYRIKKTGISLFKKVHTLHKQCNLRLQGSLKAKNDQNKIFLEFNFRGVNFS
jgi:hypothetical protein